MSRTATDGEAMRGQVIRLGLGVVAPLATAALAYGLWWISDRLVQVGPIDRATFGWAVVVPVWVMTPAVAGFAWQRLTPRNIALAAVAVGLLMSSVAALLFWLAVAHPDCEFGAVRTPGELMLPSLGVGLVIGVGLAASCVLTVAIIRRGHRWRAAFGGAAMEFGLVWVAILVAATVLLGPGCQRPPGIL